jgi:hypothetical protein
MAADCFAAHPGLLLGEEVSGVSLPVTRPTGRAIIVGQPACRSAPAATLGRLGFACTEVDDPYDAMVQLCKKPLSFSTLILSLNSLYREELAIITSVKQRFSHVEIWLTDTEGRSSALSEALHRGADGSVAPDGLHRLAATSAAPPPPLSPAPAPRRTPATVAAAPAAAPAPEPAEAAGDPLLTAEELRALLQDSPTPNSQL